MSHVDSLCSMEGTAMRFNKADCSWEMLGTSTMSTLVMDADVCICKMLNPIYAQSNLCSIQSMPYALMGRHTDAFLVQLFKYITDPKP